ncbi:barstar family protein [Streptomyces anandii]|uniref:barstar family protein n=1 Tax=Streptomyces anandii TaxID=285454 RepID=UPI0036ACE435
MDRRRLGSLASGFQANAITGKEEVFRRARELGLSPTESVYLASQALCLSLPEAKTALYESASWRDQHGGWQEALGTVDALLIEDPSPPLYRLIDQESQDVLLTSRDVHGFFVDDDLDTQQTITFVGVHSFNAHVRRTETGVLQVLGHQGEPIGQYYLGHTRLTPPGPDGFLSVRAYTCEYAQAGQIWRRWASVEPIAYGEWARRPVDSHENWLHVVQNAWFTRRHSAARIRTDEVVTLDGDLITTRPGFYCALGEAVNGPGGYFGSNLDALHDCLLSSGEASAFRMEWAHFTHSRRVLGEQFMAALLELFAEFRIEVRTG